MEPVYTTTQLLEGRGKRMRLFHHLHHGDGTLLATGHASGEIRIWDLHDGRLRWVIPSRDGAVPTALEVTPDARWLLVGDSGGDLTVWFPLRDKVGGVDLVAAHRLEGGSAAVGT